jgi:hypothetical protein
MKKLMLATFLVLSISLVPLRTAFAVPVGFIFPATQVCDGGGNTIGCSFGGVDCAIIIIVDIPLSQQVVSPGGSVSVAGATTEMTIGPDFYQASASSTSLPVGYQNLQAAAYSHTGRNVLSSALAYYAGYQLYGN